MSDVLCYRQYLSPRGTSYYSDRYFCGECARELDKPYGWPETPADPRLEGGRGSWTERTEPLLYWSFCPWCGAALDADWHENKMIRNERLVDHFDCPGTHGGDTHEFRGFSPGGHQLASTDSSLCWCGPKVEPGPMGCVVRHRDVPRPEPAAAWDDDWNDDDE